MKVLKFLGIQPTYCGLVVMRIVICITDSKEIDFKCLVWNLQEISHRVHGRFLHWLDKGVT